MEWLRGAPLPRGEHTLSAGGITEPGGFKTGKNNPCEKRECAWDTVVTTGKRKQPQGGERSRVTNCPDLPGTDPIGALKFLRPEHTQP